MVLKNTWVDGETVYAKDQNDIANAVNALDSGGTGPAGPAGPAGADGATGPAGPKGDTGATGPKGDPGDPGVAGSAGATGPAGPAGTDGATGPAGPEGPQGIAGSDGAIGPAGPQGDPGVQGETGLQGIQGEQGIPGLGINFKGALPTEDDLPDGALQGDLYIVEDPAPAHGWVWDEAESAYVDAGPVQGPQGIEGPQGIQGEAGPAGSDGAAGAQGVAGQDGAVGPAGPQGETGVAGKDGAPGPAGADGAKGDIGPAGPTAVSADEGNASVLGTDGLIFTPTSAVTDTTISADPNNVLKAGNDGGLFVDHRIQYDDWNTPITDFDLIPFSPSALLSDADAKFESGMQTFGFETYGVEAIEFVTYVASKLPPVTLPVATASVLGGVKVGTGLAVDAAGLLTATGGGGSSVANPVNGSATGLTMWVGTQAAYDAIATKDAKTVYNVVA